MVRKIVQLSLISAAVVVGWLLPIGPSFATCFATNCAVEVPEPTSLSLLACGVAATFYALRRRK